MSSLRKRGKQPQEASKEAPAQSDYDAKLKAAGSAESKLGKVVKRTFYGTLMFIFLCSLIYAGHIFLCAIVILCQFFLFKELSNVRYDCERAKQVPLFRTLMWCCFLTALFYSYGDMIYRFQVFVPYKHYHAWITFACYVLTFVASVLSLKKGQYKYQMGQLTWTILSVGLVVFQTKSVTSNVCVGLFWFILPCFLVICNDTMAYFVGLVLGRKLIKYPFLSLSPNKTYEGFLGGAFFTCILAFVLPLALRDDWFICPVVHLNQPFGDRLTCVPHEVFLFKDYQLPDAIANAVGWPTVSIMPVQLHAVLLGTFASFIAPFGGFFASAIKRAYSIKDFDSIIPGHGGFMDRLDCQLLMALAASVHYKTFIKPMIAKSIPELVDDVSHLSPAMQDDLYRLLGVQRM